MEDIYTWAVAVYIWLGPGTKTSDEALSNLVHASNFRLPLAGVPWYKAWITQSPNMFKRMLLWKMIKRWYAVKFLCYYQRIEKKMHINGVSTLAHILQTHDTEWLTRAWTFQEVVLASNPFLLCGSFVVPWSDFQRGLNFFCDRNPAMDLAPYFSPTIKRVPNQLRCTWRIFQWLLIDLPEYQPQISNQTDVVYQWRNIFDLWKAFPRPTHRNQQSIWNLPFIEQISVVDFEQQHIIPYAIWVWAKAFFWIGFLAFEMLIVGLIIVFCRQSVSPGISDGSATVFIIMIVFLILFAMICLIKGLMTCSFTDVHIWSTQNFTMSIPEQLARSIRDRSATEPKDKAFASYGILQRLKITNRKPDYAAPLGEIYRNIYIDLLRRYPSMLELLVDAGPGDLDAPTWTPDWRTATDKSWFSTEQISNRIRLADQSMTPVDVSQVELKVQGRFVGSIRFTTGAFPSTSNCASTQDEELRQQARMLFDWRVASREYVSVSRLFELTTDAMWAAINANDQKITYTKGFDHWYSSMTEFTTRHNDGSRIQNGGISECTRPDEEATEFILWCCKHLAEKRGLFVLDQVIGTGPTHMAVGDAIAQIVGVSWPLVLRKMTTGSFKIVGPALALGLMDWKGGIRQDGVQQEKLQEIVLV